MSLRFAPPAAACLALLVSASTPALAQNSPAPSAQSQDLPSAEKIAQRVVEAVGGQEALNKIRTLRVVMSMEAMGTEMTIETSWSRQGGRLSSTIMPGATMRMGTDGEVAWMTNPMDGSYALLPDTQREQLDDQASLHMAMLNPTKMAEDELSVFETVGQEQFAGRESYKCRYEDKEGAGSGFMYYDADTGMPLGFTQTQQSPMGQQTSTLTFGDWKEVAGVSFFHSLTIESAQMGGQAAQMKVTKLEANTLKPEHFEPPAEVKELLAQQDERPEGGQDEVALEDLTPEFQQQAKQMLANIRNAGSERIQQTLDQIEQGLGMVPEGDQKNLMRYLAQELRKILDGDDNNGGG